METREKGLNPARIRNQKEILATCYPMLNEKKPERKKKKKVI